MKVQEVVLEDGFENVQGEYVGVVYVWWYQVLMVCFYLLCVWCVWVLGLNGCYGVVFNYVDGSGQELELLCGQCIGCWLDKVKEWFLRCVYEVELYEENCFVILMYDDEYFLRDLLLDVGYFQKFMKCFCKRISFRKVRYYYCGEYGD